MALKELEPGQKANAFREEFIRDLRRSSILTRDFVSQIETSLLYVQGLGYESGVLDTEKEMKTRKRKRKHK